MPARKTLQDPRYCTRTSAPVCPYCLTRATWIPFKPGTKYELTCEVCGERFTYECYTETYYDSEPLEEDAL